jgi:uncharacterized membrane protein YciS (DUF1049 family)
MKTYLLTSLATTLSDLLVGIFFAAVVCAFIVVSLKIRNHRKWMRAERHFKMQTGAQEKQNASAANETSFSAKLTFNKEPNGYQPTAFTFSHSRN